MPHSPHFVHLSYCTKTRNITLSIVIPVIMQVTLTLMTNWSTANDSSDNLQQQDMEDKREEEFVFAKMALLDGEDRGTLFTLTC